MINLTDYIPAWAWRHIINPVKRWKAKRWPVNAVCNQCGYHGRRTRRGIWCPACWEDEGGELIVTRLPAEYDLRRGLLGRGRDTTSLEDRNG